MAKIHVLDKHTAELIAAGEVVERPASVVKELTENAIDAGATSVTVAIKRGGVEMIEVADNGTGIDAEYVPTAFIRHATSKIAKEEDLENIHTLGFRGEALASVASVAHVELLTKTQVDEYACLYKISAGEEQGMEAAARPVGTTITVRNLFFNTPARMKFLKKDTSEGNYVSDVVTQLALAYPEVSFKFIREEKIQFQTPGDGKLLGAAYAVLSRDFARDLLQVDYIEGAYRISGLVTPPKSARASRAMQFFFINGRFVKNRTMMAALEAAYKGVMMQGKFPGCILSLTMPPQLVDVNVHPAKTEVRFAREKEIFDLIYKAIKCILITPQSAEKELCFTQENEMPAAVFQPQPTAPAKPVRAANGLYNSVRPLAHEVKAYQDMIGTLASESSIPYKTARTEYSSVVLPDVVPAENEAATPCAPIPLTTPPTEEKIEQVEPHQISWADREAQSGGAPLRFVGEIFDTYIVAQRDSEVCFIDKHAAHERLIYESLAQNYSNVSSQMLLAPVTVNLSAEEKNALAQYENVLRDSGVEVEDFGGNSVLVRSVPADVVPEDVENLVVELASRLRSNPRETISEKTEWVLHSIACRAAMKAGDRTHAAHLTRLAAQVIDGEIPPFCPHGRPIVLKVTKKELEKQFGRQG